MKKLLLFALALAASTASAATINLTCPQLVLTGSSGSGTENCAGFTLPGGVTATDITSITVTTVFDFTFNPLLASTANASYNFAFPNAVNVSGSNISNSARPDVKSTSLCSGTGCNVFLAAFTVSDTYTGTNNVTGATFDKTFTLTYADGVPEPATIGLVGIALIGLGLIRRRA